MSEDDRPAKRTVEQSRAGCECVCLPCLPDGKKEKKKLLVIWRLIVLSVARYKTLVFIHLLLDPVPPQSSVTQSARRGRESNVQASLVEELRH